MQKIVQSEADSFLAKKRRRRLWTRVVSVLGCVVVFCTTYALILPAITAEKTTCGLEEHTHTEECYAPLPEETQTVLNCTLETLGVHSHTESCYDAEGNLICGLADFVAHTHDENCYNPEGELVCTLPENPGHVHTAACYAPVEEGHVHTDACYELQQGELICGLDENEEHQHSEDCYEQLKILVCTLAEQAPVQPELICGQPETITHQHTESCFETVEPVRELICELPEHVHSETCYDNELTPGDPTADLETAADWEASLSGVTLTGDYRADLVAIAETQLGYHESTQNFILDEAGLVKGYTRYGEWFGITHGDWCAMFVSFCLRYAEVPNFPFHSRCNAWIEALDSEEYGLYRQAGDYEPQPGDVIFFDLDGDKAAEHVGIVAELIEATETEPARLRTIEGNAGDAVRSITYEADSDLILGFGVLPEKETGYSCEKVSHLHTDYCYNTSPGGRLLCPFEEHSHDESCIPASVPEEELETLSFSGEDFTVTVQYGSEAALPEGVILTVREIPADSEEYRAYYDQSLSALAEGENTDTLIFARFFDISFILDGEVIEPEAPVSVTITYTDAVEAGEEANCQAIHFAAEGPELLQVETEALEDGGTSFTHTQDGFSVVGDLVTASYVNQNPADKGPNSLPVDYYVCIDGKWTCVGSTKTGWYNNWNGTDLWSDYNRDYITVEQAVSILGDYGFTGAEANPSRITAYQQKSSNTNIYSDTNTVSFPEGAENGVKILPLSRNPDHAGYNLYYLPGNTNQINGVASSEKLDKTANGFYTVKVFNSQGQLLASGTVQTGGSFTYSLSASDPTEWLAACADGNTKKLIAADGEIKLENITSTTTLSPYKGNEGSHSVTFKVMIDGQWQTVGSLPYYYSGLVGGSQRAYITSAMAAQFFGEYGYTATTDPGYRFGCSYNDIYTLYYANGSTKTNFCMDISGGIIKDSQVVQLWSSNNSDAQIFRVWDAGNGYSFITPIGNSSLHVNVYGYSETTTSSTQLKLSSATNANSQWRVDTGADGRTTFWSAIAPNSKVIDLSNGTMSDGGILQMYEYTGGARYWYMVQQYRIANNTVSAQNSDGTYNIGLTPESNGDIVCYYLPAETACNYEKAAESDIDTANSFWSVSVQDDTHSVYSEGELSGMVQIVLPGEDATVTVRNADGILWSCRGMDGKPVQVTETQSGGYTTFVITNIDQPVEVTATKDDPNFTVQYYANIDRYVLGSSGNLDLIDTSGKELPGNNAEQSLLWLTLEDTGAPSGQNAGNDTTLHRVKTEKQLTQMYTDGMFNYQTYPGLEYFDKLWEQSNYALDAVLVLKEGRQATSTNDDDWWWYKVNQSTWNNISFTNLASEEKAPRQEGVIQGADSTYCILLEEGTVLRLRYETNRHTYDNQASFYDYDITSGQNDNGTWRSGITGINIPTNYPTVYSSSNVANVFAFGNANCETGLGLAQWGGNNINAYNGQDFTMSDGTKKPFGNNVYEGCTFGLVTGLSDGKLVWNSSILAPNLFNDGDAAGKHTYNGGSLQFIQLGDTYTLTSANSTVGSRSGLEYFFNPSPSTGKTHTHIFTNNFWPMDAATNKTDPLMGKINDSGTCDIKVNGFYDEQNKVGANHDGVAVPISDDGRAHNWFFGMHFSLSFVLTEDYTGPLEYIFFGDDDLWVFLDDELICDIGGVHSSVGEYVNLRDYLDVGDSGQHTLSFFYTERGASGSTCWMSFTLPSVTSATTGQDTGSLSIAKSLKLEEVDSSAYSGEEYKFQVELLTSENGSALSRTFSYMRSDGTFGTIRSGGTIVLKQNETATISGIPAGTFYRVTELTTQGYHTTVNGNEGYIVSGNIETGGVAPASFVNTPYYELPQTGGSGTTLYTIGGILLITAAEALLLYYNIKRRKEERIPSS